MGAKRNAAQQDAITNTEGGGGGGEGEGMEEKGLFLSLPSSSLLFPPAPPPTHFAFFPFPPFPPPFFASTVKELLDSCSSFTPPPLAGIGAEEDFVARHFLLAVFRKDPRGYPHCTYRYFDGHSANGPRRFIDASLPPLTRAIMREDN